MLDHLLPEIQERIYNCCTITDLNNLSRTNSTYNQLFKKRLFNTAHIHTIELSQKGFKNERNLTKKLKVLKDTKVLHIQSSSTSELTCKISKTVYKAISKLKNLQELNIYGECLYIEESNFSTLCQGLKMLTKLNVSQTWGVTDMAMASIGKLDMLKDLCVSGCQITSVGCTYISSVSTLTKLDVSENAIHDYGIFLITKLPGLKTLVLGECWNITNKSMSHINQHLFLLNELVISACLISDQGLSRISSLSALTKLDASDCDSVTDRGISYISANLVALKELIITRCHHITDACVPYFRNMRTLEKLDIRNCDNITDLSGLSHVTLLLH